MDEARNVIRRLERIEALRGTHAPADELLGEVRQLLSEGEAWLAAERGGRGHEDGRATESAAAALAGCRAGIAEREEVVPGAAGATDL